MILYDRLCVFVFNRAWRDTTAWLDKETKMFNLYVEMFSSQIRSIFHIDARDSDSEVTKAKKNRKFKSIVRKLLEIMEKRHYVSIIQREKLFRIYKMRSVAWSSSPLWRFEPARVVRPS